MKADDSIVKKYPDGLMYTGPLKKGLHHGIGTYLLPNGYEYKGTWVDGQIQGKGIAKYPDGTIYEGDFKAGKPFGNGEMRFLQNRTYRGEWRNGIPDGVGVLKLSDGSIYKGDFKNFKFGRQRIFITCRFF